MWYGLSAFAERDWKGTGAGAVAMLFALHHGCAWERIKCKERNEQQKSETNRCHNVPHAGGCPAATCRGTQRMWLANDMFRDSLFQSKGVPCKAT